ncbi:MAG: PKD domain-containing protein [Bacteroidaceae bacterium]|nr:PKD domain-containing protein [Bacteroidaceae bacterium]
MNKKLLLIVFLVPSLHSMAQIEEYTMPDGKVVKIDRSVFPNLRYDVSSKSQPADYVARRKARAKQGGVELPPFVNNGQDKYFPPIFNQDGGSCGSAQSVGYMFTHEMNSYRDLDSSLPENQYPTHFTWLLSYQTSNIVDIASGIGIPNVPTYGGRTYSRLFGSQTHDDPDYGWMQGYDKWYSAMWNKISHDISFAPTNTPEGRQELKEWLYNYSGDTTMHGGGVAGIGVAAYGTWAAIPSSPANKAAGVAGMKYVKAWGDTFNHALTVCGYDDRIEFDLDGDGIVGEVDEDEVGAWIIANSWGDGWENKGFIYCPYKYSYSVGNDTWAWSPGAHIVRQDYRPLRTIKLLMDYSHRSELLLCAGVSEDINATKPDKIIPFEHFRNAGNTLGASPAPEVPMLGHWTDGMHYEPMEFGYDLTDLTATVDRTKPLKYFFIVKRNANTIGSGHIYKASIINYEIENEGVEIPFDQSDVELQKGSGEVVVSVVVPGEQLYPVANLSFQDGVLVWSAPQASSLTLTGYHVYENNILVAQLPVGQSYYTPADGAEGPFTIKAVYRAGEYMQESAPSNPVVFQPLQHETNNLVMFNKGGLTIPNAISDILNEATIEFWIRATKNVSYIDQVGPGWGKFLFHNDSNGTLSVGWDSNSLDRLDVRNVFSSTSRWNHIAIVIKGNMLTLYVNGLKKGQITSRTYSGLPAFGDLQFGHTNENQWWLGGLDDIRIWSTARTQTEIRSNMRIPIAMPALMPDLLIYLPMDPIEIDGKTYLRECVSGKHASFHSIGSWEIQDIKGPFTGVQNDPYLTIDDEETTHLADIPFRLMAQSALNATDWTWTVADTQMPALHGMSPTFTFSQAGTYTIVCTALFATGETLTETKEVVVVEGSAPVAAFDVLDADLPAGDRFNFINRSKGDGCTYLWSMPGAEVEQTGGTNATALYPQTGTFSVTLTVTNPYGSNSVTHQVTVRESAPSPRFELSQTAIMLGDTIQLIDNSRYTPLSWKWELNNGSRALLVEDQSPYIVPTAPGIYDISLQVTNQLGSNSLTRNRYLIVSNDDPGTCLNFTGKERLQLSCPFSQQQSALTLEWWMRPQQYQGSVNLSSSQGKFSTSVDSKGVLSVTLGSKTIKSDEGYIVCNEWHHYAIVFRQGAVKFYRDALLFSSPASKLASNFPALESITMGSETSCFSGQIDEVRLWGAALDEDRISAYCNKHISDVQAAQEEDKLLLYYDFNQNGGDVLDRTSSLCHAQRLGFGPDGDAWNSSLGVFTLDTKALMHGDISSIYLTNYKNPFITASGTVNPNNSSRFLRLAMRNSRSKWQDANAVVAGSITTGAHIDTAHRSDITFETQWSGFASPLLDYRLWQPVLLPAGRYRFSVTFSDGSDAQESRLVVCEGKMMVSDKVCEGKAIAWCKLVDGSLSFSLAEETQVSLGIIVNLTGQASFGISAFKLEGVSYETLTPTEPTGIALPTLPQLEQPAFRGIYNLSGQRLQHVRQGINIVDGKKMLSK